jgi:hypothetical protein
LIAELAAGVWIGYLFHANSESGRNVIKAHLLAIRNDGILPSSTPIYQKFLIYQLFLDAAVWAFLSFFVLNVFLSVMKSEGWIVALANNMIQFAIVGGLMVLFRPRGKFVDEYMQPDVELGEEARGEVALEELSGFEIESAQDGMREWEEGMNLPLHPLVVSSRGQPGESTRNKK